MTSLITITFKWNIKKFQDSVVINAKKWPSLSFFPLNSFFFFLLGKSFYILKDDSVLARNNMRWNCFSAGITCDFFFVGNKVVYVLAAVGHCLAWKVPFKPGLCFGCDMERSSKVVQWFCRDPLFSWTQTYHYSLYLLSYSNMII